MPGERAVGTVYSDTRTAENKSKSSDDVNIIKEKRDGNIMGSMCANGIKQRTYFKEGDNLASPEVSLEALFTTLLDTKEFYSKYEDSLCA